MIQNYQCLDFQTMPDKLSSLKILKVRRNPPTIYKRVQLKRMMKEFNQERHKENPNIAQEMKEMSLINQLKKGKSQEEQDGEK